MARVQLMVVSFVAWISASHPLTVPHAYYSSSTAASIASTQACLMHWSRLHLSKLPNEASQESTQEEMASTTTEGPEDPLPNNKNNTDSSLDSILNRARTRQLSPLLRLQASAGAPVWTSPDHWTITRGDALIVVVAILIDSPGFAAGFLLGKWSWRSVLMPFLLHQKQHKPRKNMLDEPAAFINLRSTQFPPMFLVQLYPVLIACILDQLWS